MSEKALTLRALSRATLARQMLLAREKVKPLAAVERLAGVQAQLARPPFVGLWSRIAGFSREDLARAIHAKDLVRATWLRATIHLVSARDYRRLRAVVQRSLDRALSGVLRERMGDIDLETVLGEARRFFGKAPATFDAFRTHLAAWRPKADVRAMSYTVRCTLPLVQVPAEGTEWAYPGAADFALAERFVGGEIDARADAAAIVLRHLAAFGPATVADTQYWSGIPRLQETFDALRPRLVTYRDDGGRTLWDVKGAPIPDDDVPAPPRLLPEFDGVILGLLDRRRFLDDAHKKELASKNLFVPAVFLVDGRIAGKWTMAAKKGVAAVTLSPFVKIAKAAKDALAAEAEALARFVEPLVKKVAVKFGK